MTSEPVADAGWVVFCNEVARVALILIAVYARRGRPDAAVVPLAAAWQQPVDAFFKLSQCGKIRFLPFGKNPDGFNVEAPSLFKINLSLSTFNYFEGQATS